MQRITKFTVLFVDTIKCDSIEFNLDWSNGVFIDNNK